MHKILFYNKFIIRLYMFRVLCAHRQEIKTVSYASTCFKHYVLIVRRSKLYYTASGIITLSKKVAFIQLLKLFGVHLLYVNCRMCLPCRWPSSARDGHLQGKHVL